VGGNKQQELIMPINKYGKKKSYAKKGGKKKTKKM
jgi:hypothetical protein